MHIYNVESDVVQGRLYENYLTRKFILRNIFNTKISQITVDQIMNIICQYLQCTYVTLSTVLNWYTYVNFDSQLSMR